MKLGSEHNIGCPKYGGSRFAPACCTQDRYKTCRRNCTSLAKHLKLHPDLPVQAKKYYEAKQRKSESGDLFLYASMKDAGRGLPNLDLQCALCGFKAKTVRGRKVHLWRTHGRKQP